ncbi:prepilin-type N-terminal cleavage/methylation domain-containing protein [Acetobacterium fimetarium]|uniref:Prepilin-type N-terminal cleavage/methylation domain-containing protein n=1 Tax=Acetobacterium fimetarium TaxID=52691 RepID=A0ABR6WV15_9FIRM|nr:prepilin-type N-terminal cleavage/methylation domain-containing protein [Acetobacterium fimetarium]MBC3804447.1 prepilin-type N-terminal cleavage/methylation domain-containing protein [Acetobacterium fimetarium]
MKKLIDTRSTKGFTLIELLVALLITGILLATISSVFLMSQKIYMRGVAISNKEGTITNTETNLQEVLPVAILVVLADKPKEDTEKSYSIGFKPDGTCEEVIMSLVVNAKGEPVLDSQNRKQFSKSVNTIPRISEIKVAAVQQMQTNADGTTTAIDAYTLSYELVPADKTMSILKGGVVMNNIKQSNNNAPNVTNAAGKNLVNRVPLNDNGGTVKQYLVLTLDDSE